MPLSYPLNPVLGGDTQPNTAVFDYGLFRKKILITGANGQLGNEMRLLAPHHLDMDFDFTDVAELDLCDADAVDRYCEALRPAYIVNCAAYTAVDKAEDDTELCWKINKDAAENLAKVATRIGAKLLHVSTDYVFDGTNTSPYLETDPVCPASAYGRSKLDGERAVEACCPQSVIVRTAWLYSSFGNNFVKTMIRLGKERDSLNVVSDQIGSPTFAGDLAKALMAVIESAEKGHFVPGIYHYSNDGVCSWYEFTLKIHALAGITTCAVQPIPSAEYPAKAQRPAYSVLSKEKIKATYGITIPHWETSLAECIATLK
jgi:dTDP-4-dehydrorhamnose reductase